ncbi:MAG: thiamine-phosphate kinase [Pseudomonadota bacterium]
MSEFDLIRNCFRPLTAGNDLAFGLQDDVAQLSENGLVVSKDVLIEGIHFLKNDPIEDIAWKALMVNVSDIVAKGARPLFYCLGCAWPKGTDPSHVQDFAGGLKSAQDVAKLTLLGGDTTATRKASDPFVISVTIFGQPAREGVVARAGTGGGDDLYVTGTIGDAFLGLKELTGKPKLPADLSAEVISCYRRPEPAIAFGTTLAGLASAAIDVSDGLVADAGHLASINKKQFILDADRIPLSPAAEAWVGMQKDPMKAIGALACGGDDYSILFTAPQSRRRAIDIAGQVTKTRVTRIGTVKPGNGINVTDRFGDEIPISQRGFDHFQES